MQTLADVMGVPIHVADSGQACALGAAMYASVVSGLHPDIRSAQRLMCHGIISSYTRRQTATKSTTVCTPDIRNCLDDYQ